jgi:ribosome-associated heat shock protein Hsp15
MDTPAATDRIRIDKWLWYARFFKTRSLATRVVGGGSVRVNGNRVGKAAFMVGPGDTLTFTRAERVVVARILAIGTRRGPAPEAQALYEDLTPVPEPSPPEAVIERKGRPTKKDRRNARLLKGSYLD